MAQVRAGQKGRTFAGFIYEARALTEQLGDGAIGVPAFLEKCTRLTNAAIGCSRTGIWLFVETAEGRVLRCLAMYDSIADRMTRLRMNGEKFNRISKLLSKMVS